MPNVMTHKERLCGAMHHQEVDKVPCSPRLGQALHILYDDRTTNGFDLTLRAAQSSEIDLDPHFVVDSGVPNVFVCTDANSCGLKDVEIEVSVEDDGDCDLIVRAISTPGGQLKEKLKKPKPEKIEYGLWPNPSHIEYLVKKPEDLDALRYLVPDPCNYDVAREYHALEQKVGNLGIVLVAVHSPLDHQVGFARSIENLMVDYYEQRDFFNELLEMWFDKMMAETKAVLEKGVKFIFGGWYFASLSVGWSPQIFREVFFPMIKSHVELVHSYDAVYDYYDDGKCMGIIDMIKEANVDVFETLTPPPVGDVDLREVKSRIGDTVCLKGYADLLHVIQRGTPGDVEKMVKQAIEIAGPGSGFILGTSDSIRENTPRENIRAYFAAAKKYGMALRCG